MEGWDAPARNLAILEQRPGLLIGFQGSTGGKRKATKTRTTGSPPIRAGFWIADDNDRIAPVVSPSASRFMSRSTRDFAGAYDGPEEWRPDSADGARLGPTRQRPDTSAHPGRHRRLPR